MTRFFMFFLKEASSFRTVPNGDSRKKGFCLAILGYFAIQNFYTPFSTSLSWKIFWLQSLGKFLSLKAFLAPHGGQMSQQVFFFPISVNLQHDWSMVRVDCFRKALFGKKNDHMTSARQNPCHLVVLLMFPFSILSWSEFQLYGADCSHEQAGKPIVRSGSCQD